MFPLLVVLQTQLRGGGDDGLHGDGPRPQVRARPGGGERQVAGQAEELPGRVSCRPRTAVARHTLSTARRSSGWSRTWTSLWRGRDRRDSVITHSCPGCHSGCEQPKLENICRQISAQVKGYHRWKPDYPRPRQEDPSSPCLATNQILFKTERDQDQDIVYL